MLFCCFSLLGARRGNASSHWGLFTCKHIHAVRRCDNGHIRPNTCCIFTASRGRQGQVTSCICVTWALSRPRPFSRLAAGLSPYILMGETNESFISLLTTWKLVLQTFWHKRKMFQSDKSEENQILWELEICGRQIQTGQNNKMTNNLYLQLNCFD